MEADPVREQEPGVVGSSREARELNLAFAPGRLGRTVLLAECLASRLSAALNTPCSSELLCATFVFSVSLWCTFFKFH